MADAFAALSAAMFDTFAELKWQFLAPAEMSSCDANVLEIVLTAAEALDLSEHQLRQNCD